MLSHEVIGTLNCLRQFREVPRFGGCGNLGNLLLLVCFLICNVHCLFSCLVFASASVTTRTIVETFLGYSWFTPFGNLNSGCAASFWERYFWDSPGDSLTKRKRRFLVFGTATQQNRTLFFLNKIKNFKFSEPMLEVFPS